MQPTPLAQAIAFCDTLRSQPNATGLTPGPRHWQIFADLCTQAGARGNLVPDAYLAALAIETGSEWITTDGDYRRFRGLRLRHPLDHP
jgi:toxin-antitoxin system PIN domain toxin